MALEEDVDAQLALVSNRLTHSTGEDRLEAIEQMLSLSRKEFGRVGKVGLPVLVEVLTLERDEHVILAVLDVMMTLVTISPTIAESKTLAIGHVDYLLNCNNLIEKLLLLLKQQKLWMRFKSIQLLRVMAETRSSETGSAVMKQDAGMMRLVEALNDSREEVRNELIILLRHLTETKEEIQQFCAFSQVFKRLLDIMRHEGLYVVFNRILHYHEYITAISNLHYKKITRTPTLENRYSSSAVVLDCLNVLLNCVSRNQVVRKMFMEPGDCLRGILPILQIEAQSTLSSKNDEDDVLQSSNNKSREQTRSLVLNIVTSLVMRLEITNNVDEATRKELQRRATNQIRENQQRLAKIGYLDAVAILALQENNVLALDTLGHLLHNNSVMQSQLHHVSVLYGAKKKRLPASVCLVRTALSSTRVENAEIQRGRTPRDAAIRAFLNAMSGEEASMTFLGHTMSPSPQILDESKGIHVGTPGRLLVDTLLKHASLTLSSKLKSQQADAVWIHWRCCRIFESLLSSGGETSRMLALRISCNDDFLLHRLLRLLDVSREIRAQAKDNDVSNIVCVLQCSILRLVSVWLCHCPRAVDEVLVKPSNLFLYELVTDCEDVTAQWCVVLFGICMIYVSAQCNVTSEHVLNTIIKRIGLRKYTDTMTMVTNSSRWKAAKKQHKLRYKYVYENPSSLFATHEEIHRGLPPTLDGSCVSFLKEVMETIPRRMIDLYGESTSDGKTLSAEYLERNISVLRSLLLLQARREGDDVEKKLLKDEPEMVKLYDAYATAMREVDRIRTDAATELKIMKTEMGKYKKETEVLREEKKKMEEENQNLMKKQNVSVTSSSAAPPPKPKQDQGGSFLAMGSAIERFAEIESLKIEIARLTENLNDVSKERDGLQSKVAEQSVLLNESRHLKEEQHDLLELFAHVEAERIAAREELERIGGIHALKRAKMHAEESLERACDDVGKEDEKNSTHHELTPPSPPLMRKQHAPVRSSSETTTSVFDV